ncbi:MAG: Fic family protein [Pseudomonadota bacterium]
MSEGLDEKLYVYPDTTILRNNFGIYDSNKLEELERLCIARRIKQEIPNGSFDLPHLQTIHKHLFQDIYPWAGELRQVPLNKGGNQFMPPNRLEIAMHDIHTRLEEQKFLKALSKEKFSNETGIIIGDINHVHPFREGNGRTQLCYLKLLAKQAGHEIELDRIEKDKWLEASKESHFGNYEKISETIQHLIKVRERKRSRSR